MTTIVAVLLTAFLCLALHEASLRRIERELTLSGSETVKHSQVDAGIKLLARSRRVRELITSLKQSEANHKARYKILTDNVAAAVMLHEGDGTILWCSPFTEVVTGFSLTEIYRGASEFLRLNLHEDDRDAFERSLKIVATGEPFQFRYRFYHKSGRSLWLETRTVPIFDSSFNGYVALSITLDVTAQVMTQNQLEERNRDLSEFTYMISHDLKAPLLTIAGMLEVIDADEALKQAPSLLEPLSYIRRASRRLESLVQGVIELARVSASPRSLEPIPLSDVINEVIDEHRLQVERSNSHITTVTELPVVLGNRTQLYQVISNLVGNAIKYRSEDRPLTVSIEALRGRTPRRTAIVIRDNGRGISPQHIDQIFKPFARAGEETIEGSGIGLASVKKLVEKLGGAITVESSLGSGTIFTIELRKAPDESTR